MGSPDVSEQTKEYFFLELLWIEWVIINSFFYIEINDPPSYFREADLSCDVFNYFKIIAMKLKFYKCSEQNPKTVQ